MDATDLAESLRSIAADIDTHSATVAGALDMEADRLDPPVDMCCDCEHCPLPYNPKGECLEINGTFGAGGGKACYYYCQENSLFVRRKPAPASPPLLDESKLPQWFALSGRNAAPKIGEFYNDWGHDIVCCKVADETGGKSRPILAKRPIQPPDRHVFWDREDGGGYRDTEHAEWSMRKFCVDGDLEAVQTNKTWSGNPHWLLSPPAPPGYHHVPKSEGGGLRPWQEDEWFIGPDGEAVHVTATGICGTQDFWIIAPDTPSGVLFVEDENGVHSFGTGCDRTFHRRVDLTPAQMQQVLAIVEGGDDGG